MVNSIIPLRLISRPRTTLDWKCRRARWWGYEYGGRGVVGNNLSTAMFLGTALHDGLAAIATQHPEVDIDQIASTAQKGVYEGLMTEAGGDEGVMEYAQEQGALVEGLLRGFYRHVWPRLIAAYPTIRAIEQEMVYEYNGMVFGCRPDLVLSDSSGNLVYIEYKSTSTKGDKWINSWDTAIQLHSTVKAIEATLGEKVSQVIVQGLYKGFESYGKQSSPFCYAYRRQGTPPFSKDEIAYEYKAGFRRYPTWNLEGGTRNWVDGMPDSVLADQFPQTPPIYVKDDLVDAFFKQTYVREMEIQLATQMYEAMGDDEEAKKAILDTSFPQSWEQCVPAFGSSCPFRMLCHGGVSDPLMVGFEWRDQEHEKVYRDMTAGGEDGIQ